MSVGDANEVVTVTVTTGNRIGRRTAQYSAYDHHVERDPDPAGQRADREPAPGRPTERAVIGVDSRSVDDATAGSGV